MDEVNVRTWIIVFEVGAVVCIKTLWDQRMHRLRQRRSDTLRERQTNLLVEHS